MSQPIGNHVRAILDAHLDAVESALAAAGQPRGGRRAIVDDLEAQILEMLSERTGSRPPEPSDMEAILEQMDPPQAYATGRPAPRNARPRTTRPKAQRDWPRAIALICLILCGLLLIMWPTIVDVMSEHAGAELLTQRTDLTSISMTRAEVSSEMRFGLWLTGTLMVLGGVAAMTHWIRRRD